MGVLICLKKAQKKKMEERVRKVLHQDGASWNVTKLFSGRGDKLRLSPFLSDKRRTVCSERAKQRQTHQIQVDKTHKQWCSVCALRLFCLNPDRALTWWRSHQWPLFLFFFLPRRRWFQPLVRRSGLTARPLSQKKKKKNTTHKPCEEAGEGMRWWRLRLGLLNSRRSVCTGVI